MARPAVSAEKRFWKYVNKNGPVPTHRPELGPCWLWTGAKNSWGYGYFRGPAPESKQIRAHNFSWGLHRGTMPEGLEPDHLCRSRACVNHEHLEAVTTKENARRRGAAVTHCPRGHAYDEKNTIINSNGGRKCRACNRTFCERYRQSLTDTTHLPRQKSSATK